MKRPHFKKTKRPERRRFRRIDKPLPIAHRLYKRKNCRYQEKWTHSIAQNISAGGFLFRTEIKYEKDDVIEIRLGMPYFEELFHCYAKVMRNEESREEEVVYSTAAGFIGLSDQETHCMNRIILASDKLDKRIMVVDRDISHTIVFKAALEKFGYETVIADSEEEAIEKFKALPPSYVLINEYLTAKESRSLCKKIRDISQGQCLVFIVSADNHAETIRAAFDSGAAGYFFRKQTKQDILNKLIKYLSAA